MDYFIAFKIKGKMMSMGMERWLLVLLSEKSSRGRLHGSVGKEVCLSLGPTWWKERNHSFRMQNKNCNKSLS